ncbi:TonB-dependent receptor [Maribacter sp. HTCC2170]|uniref:TonB-dependent receptor n=1 Tax=Maribacter sp. (strain HTCC2170 / KCCM 42371) TaxID=313603 RepID=UPI00006BD3F8|nr:TonB-dependent receptor [Maribacter sp. HTCC2170]EAR03049.1 putative TonB-dependent outer membrane receptor protein [Maribacter sp. HTCC2170]
MKKMYMAMAAFLVTAIAFSQGTITGTVVDGEMGGPLPGASVVVQGTTNGTSSDFDGNFSIDVDSDSGTLVVSYIGYVTQSVPFSSTGNIGSISLQPDAQELEGVVVTGIMDIAKDRETPVAVSTITASVIQEKLGSQEFPELLRSTPSVYATKTGGGFGDGRINIRGFDSQNTAVMINGIPVNDMENGSVYWSNWAGLSDVTTAMQVQRGLGSSKLAISSVGGTINIITKSTEREEGGAVTASAGNDGYLKTNVAYNTGKMENGFAASVLLGRTAGDGYINGTAFEGYNYFIGLGYEPNDRNNFQFMFTGAPQVHNQRTSSFFNTATVAQYLDYGAKYNFNQGTLNGEEFGIRRNFYHKPVASLNWENIVSDKSTLSVSAYASFGRGGGTGDIGRLDGKFASDSRLRDNQGNMLYDAISASNGGTFTDFNGFSYGNSLDPYTNSYIVNDDSLRDEVDPSNPNALPGVVRRNGMIRRASVNSHNWFGAIANFHTDVNENWSHDFGIDIRKYKGIHYRRVDNLLGADGYRDNDNVNNRFHVVTQENPSEISNLWNVFKSIDNDKKIDYYNDGLVRWYGAFGQIEYKNDITSLFLQGSVSQQGFKRIDYFNYLDSDPAQETDWENILGGNIKGGLNVNLNEANNVFVNAGYYSKQPNFDAVYIDFQNNLNPELTNEKVLGIEAGYGLNLGDFRTKVNVYRTSWKDRFISVGIEDNGNANINGVEQIHKGIEIEADWRANEFVSFKGMLSLGDWEYGGDATGKAFDDSQTFIRDVTLYLDEVKVGDAAQFTSNIEMIVRPCEGLKLSANWYTASDNYAFISADDFDSPDHDGSLRLPTYNLFDAGAYYRFNLGGTNTVSLAVNVNNIFDSEYLAESLTNYFPGDRGNASTYQGINTSNKAFFGFGRTWNASLRYNF